MKNSPVHSVRYVITMLARLHQVGSVSLLGAKTMIKHAATFHSVEELHDELMALAVKDGVSKASPAVVKGTLTELCEMLLAVWNERCEFIQLVQLTADDRDDESELIPVTKKLIKSKVKSSIAQKSIKSASKSARKAVKSVRKTIKIDEAMYLKVVTLKWIDLVRFASKMGLFRFGMTRIVVLAAISACVA